jgi:hypothetical protein
MSTNHVSISDLSGIDGLEADAAGKAAAVRTLISFVGIGPDFAKLRRSVGCSISELAEYVPADRRSIEAIESGRVPHLSFEQWQRLARWAHSALHGIGQAA